MKDCRNIQELLKSDYLDGEASQTKKRCIDEHLARCPECSRLKEDLGAQRALFKNAKRQEVPGRLWQEIRETIIAQRLSEEASSAGGFFGRLRDRISKPRPVFALSGVFTAIILIAVLTGAVIRGKQLSNRESAAETLVGYSLTLNGVNDDVLNGLGTDIEEYFL